MLSFRLSYRITVFLCGNHGFEVEDAEAAVVAEAFEERGACAPPEIVVGEVEFFEVVVVFQGYGEQFTA